MRLLRDLMGAFARETRHMAFTIRGSAIALTVLFASLTVLPVQTASAQQSVQRIPVSSILGRLDLLESEMIMLRQKPGSAGSEVSTRIDQLEGELRRLTGIVERLEYDATRQAEISEKRMLDLETRLQSLESQPPTPYAAARPAQGAAGSLGTTPIIVQPPAPFVQTPPLPQPNINLGGGPAVAFGAPRQVDTSPDLAALPFPAAPSQPALAPAQNQTQPTIALTTPVAPLAPAVAQNVPAQNPVALTPTGPQAQYDDALRMLNLGEFDAAGSALEAIVRQYPRDPVSGSAQYWLGDMHLRLGRYNEAAKAFLDSFKGWPEGPKAPDSLLKLGMTLASASRRRRAPPGRAR